MLKRHISAALLFALTALHARDSGAAVPVNVVTEAVNNYTAGINCTPTNCLTTCGAADLCYSVANNAGFVTNLTSVNPNTGTNYFSIGTHTNYTNSAVYDKDFYDPERGSITGNDTNNFDKPGTHISYFTGHGLSIAGITDQNCTTSSQCTNTTTSIGANPPGSLRLPGTCLGTPAHGPYGGVCAYTQDRKIFTKGAGDSYSGVVKYGGAFTYEVAFGESAQAGNWRGAGTNGGTNLVVLDASWPSIPGHQGDSLLPLLAGAHMVAVPQPVWGDTANISNRGATFGRYAALNPNSAIFQAWKDTLNSLSTADGGTCAPGTIGSQAGGRGFNGCGCNLIVTMDAIQSWSEFHTTESWHTLMTSTIWDAEGNGWWNWAATCNYAEAFTTYPWAR